MCFVRYQFFAECQHHGLVLQECCQDAIIVTLDDLQVLVDNQLDEGIEERTVDFLLSNGLIPHGGASAGSKTTSITSIDHGDRRSDGQRSFIPENIGVSHSKNGNSLRDLESSDEDRKKAIHRIYNQWLNRRPPKVVRESESDACWQVECPDIDPDEIEAEAESCEDLWMAIPDEQYGGVSTVFAPRDSGSLGPKVKSDEGILIEVDEPSLRGGTEREPDTTRDHEPQILDEASGSLVVSPNTADDAQSEKTSWADMVEEEEADQNIAPTRGVAREEETSNEKTSTSEANEEEEEQDPAKRVWRPKWRDAIPDTPSNWRDHSSSPRKPSRYIQAPPIDVEDLKENTPFSYRSPSTSRTSSNYVKAPPIGSGSRSTSKSSSYRPPIISRANSYIEPLPNESVSFQVSRPSTYILPVPSVVNALGRQSLSPHAAIWKPWTESRLPSAELTAPKHASKPFLSPKDAETPNDNTSNMQSSEASSMVKSKLDEYRASPQDNHLNISPKKYEIHGLTESIDDGSSHSSRGIGASEDLGMSLEKRPASLTGPRVPVETGSDPGYSDATTEPFPKLSESSIARRQSQQLARETEGGTCHGTPLALLASADMSEGSLVLPQNLESPAQGVVESNTDVELHVKGEEDISSSSTLDINKGSRKPSQTVKRRKQTSGLEVDVLRTEKPEPSTNPKPVELDTDSPSAFPTLGASPMEETIPSRPSTPKSVRGRRMSSIIMAATRRRTNSQADTVPVISRRSSPVLDGSSLSLRNSTAADSSCSTAPQEMQEPKASSISPATGLSELAATFRRSPADKAVDSGSSSVRGTVQSYSAVVKSFKPTRKITTSARELKSPAAEDWPEIPPEEDWAKQRASLAQASSLEAHKKVHAAGAPAQRQHSEKDTPARKDGPTIHTIGDERRAKASSGSVMTANVAAQSFTPLKDNRHVEATLNTSQKVGILTGEGTTDKEGVSNALEPELSGKAQHEMPKESLTGRNKELLAKQTWRSANEVSNTQKVKTSDPKTGHKAGKTEKAPKSSDSPRTSKPSKSKRRSNKNTGTNPTTLNSLPEIASQPTQLSKAEIYNREAPAPPLLTTSRDRSWASVLRSRSPAVSQASSRCSSTTAGEYVTPPHTPHSTIPLDNLSQETLSSNSDGYYSAQEDINTSTDQVEAKPITPTPAVAMDDHEDMASALKALADESPTPTRSQTPKPSHMNLVLSNLDNQENLVPGYRRSIPSVDAGARIIFIIPFEAQCSHIDRKLTMWKANTLSTVTPLPPRVPEVAVHQPLTYAKVAAPNEARQRTEPSSSDEIVGNARTPGTEDDEPKTSVIPSQSARGRGGRGGRYRGRERGRVGQEGTLGYDDTPQGITTRQHTTTVLDGSQWYQHAPSLSQHSEMMTLDAMRSQVRDTFPQGFIPHPVPSDVQYYPAPVDPATGQFILPPMPYPAQTGPYVPEAGILPGLIYPVVPPFQPMMPVYNPISSDLQFPQQVPPYHFAQQAFAGQQQVPPLHPYIAAQIPRHNQTMFVHHHSSPTRGRDPLNLQAPTHGQMMQFQQYSSPTRGSERPYPSLGSGAPGGHIGITQRRISELISEGSSSARPRITVDSFAPGQLIINNPTHPYPQFENDETSRRSEGLWVDTVGHFTFIKPDWPRAQYLGGAWRTYMPTEQEIAEKNNRMQLTRESGLEIWHVGQQVRKIQMCQNPVFEYVGWVNEGKCPICAPDQHH
ncbi:MAG: hypothetical protein M1812_004399 [Candelaria pacifica]|nr:MAG: hypothetical protein M1812_004399 [Candelaria pacifica]